MVHACMSEHAGSCWVLHPGRGCPVWMGNPWVVTVVTVYDIGTDPWCIWSCRSTMMGLCCGRWAAGWSMRGAVLVWLYCLDSSKGTCWWCWEKSRWWKFSSWTRALCRTGLSLLPHWRLTCGLLLRCTGALQGSPRNLLGFKGAVGGSLFTAISHGRIGDVVQTSHTLGKETVQWRHLNVASDCLNPDC